MILKTKKAIKTMVEKHKEVINEHKDMMWVHVFLALIVWVFLHMLFPPVHTESKAPMDNDNNIAMIEHYAPSPIGKETITKKSLLEMVNNPNDEQREMSLHLLGMFVFMPVWGKDCTTTIEDKLTWTMQVDTMPLPDV